MFNNGHVSHLESTRCILVALVFFATFVPTTDLRAGIIHEMLFSDKSYARCIEAHGWITTAAQAGEALINQEDPVQLPYRELHRQYVYLVVRLKNLEPYLAQGTLEITCPDSGSVTIGGICLAPKLAQYEYYVIPLGKKCVSHSKHDNKPQFSFKWKKLYVQ